MHLLSRVPRAANRVTASAALSLSKVLRVRPTVRGKSTPTAPAQHTSALRTAAEQKSFPISHLSKRNFSLDHPGQSPGGNSDPKEADYSKWIRYLSGLGITGIGAKELYDLWRKRRDEKMSGVSKKREEVEKHVALNNELLEKTDILKPHPRIWLYTNVDALINAKQAYENELTKQLDENIRLQGNICNINSTPVIDYEARCEFENLLERLKKENYRLRITQKINEAVLAHLNKEYEKAHFAIVNAISLINDNDCKLESNEIFVGSITANVVFASICNIKALIERTQVKHKDSENSFKEALRHSGDPNIHSNKGWLHNERGEAKEALNEHLVACKAKLHDASLINGVAFSYHQLGDGKKSFEKYSAALLRKPSNLPVLLCNRAWLLLDVISIDPSKRNQYATQAITDCKNALEKDPNHRNGIYYQAIANACLGNFDLAISGLTHAKGLFDENTEKVKVIEDDMLIIKQCKENNVMFPMHKMQLEGHVMSDLSTLPDLTNNHTIVSAAFVSTVGLFGGKLQPSVLPKGFVFLKDVDPSIKQDMKYCGIDNFIGRRIVGYNKPRCILTKETADALSAIQKKLADKNLSLMVYDCYRPQRAVDDFVKWGGDEKDQKMKNEFYPRVNKKDLFDLDYISHRSGHSRGSTVDLTVIDLKTGIPLDMGTRYDFMDALSHSSSQGVTEAQQSNRKFLRDLMLGSGFRGIDSEWWHFTFINERFRDEYFDFPVDDGEHENAESRPAFTCTA